MAVFESLMQMMVDSGASYMFMWLFFAAIFYGFIDKYELLEESSATAGAALGASFFLVIGIFYAGPTMAVILDFAGGLGLIAVVIFGAATLLGLSGVNVMEMGEDEGLEGNILAGAGLLFVAIALISAIGFNVSIESALGGVSGDVYQDVVFPISFLIFLLLLVGAAVDGGGDEE
jgi:hypothetical protein